MASLAHTQEIADEIIDWVAHLSETTETSGPRCPYAQPAIDAGMVAVHVTHDLEVVSRIKATNPPIQNAVHIFAWTNHMHLTLAEFRDWLHYQNTHHFGTWLLAFHPADPATDYIPGFPEIIDGEYAVIIMLNLEELTACALPRTPSNQVLQRTNIARNFFASIDPGTLAKFDAIALSAYAQGHHS